MSKIRIFSKYTVLLCLFLMIDQINWIIIRLPAIALLAAPKLDLKNAHPFMPFPFNTAPPHNLYHQPPLLLIGQFFPPEMAVLSESDVLNFDPFATQFNAANPAKRVVGVPTVIENLQLIFVRLVQYSDGSILCIVPLPRIHGLDLDSQSPLPVESQERQLLISKPVVAIGVTESVFVFDPAAVEGRCRVLYDVLLDQNPRAVDHGDADVRWRTVENVLDLGGVIHGTWNGRS